MSSLLFRKLFMAFWLATITSFAIGAGFMWIGQPNAMRKAPHPSDSFESARQIASTEGLAAALPLIRQQATPEGTIALFDAQGSLIAGNSAIGRGEIATVLQDRNHDYRLVGKTVAPIDMPRFIPLLAGAIASLIFSGLIAWYLARPLARLNEGFRALAAGNLATRIRPMPHRNPDEIESLAIEFDRMAAQLQILVDSQQKLFHDISHELRSPLARLDVAVGLARQSPEKIPQMLPRIEQESQQLNKLIEELLTLARLKAGVTDPSIARVDIVDLITAIVEDANFEAEAKRCEVRFTGSEPFVTDIHGEMLYRAFENIIRNAIKFSPPDSVVHVEASCTQDRLLLTVKDQGPGVPPEGFQDIFEPFKRIIGKNSGEAGFGLGLTIAKHAVERHGGTIGAHAGENGCGLTIEIEVPRHLSE